MVACEMIRGWHPQHPTTLNSNLISLIGRFLQQHAVMMHFGFEMYISREWDGVGVPSGRTVSDSE